MAPFRPKAAAVVVDRANGCRTGKFTRRRRNLARVCGGRRPRGSRRRGASTRSRRTWRGPPHSQHGSQSTGRLSTIQVGKSGRQRLKLATTPRVWLAAGPAAGEVDREPEGRHAHAAVLALAHPHLRSYWWVRIISGPPVCSRRAVASLSVNSIRIQASSILIRCATRRG